MYVHINYSYCYSYCYSYLQNLSLCETWLVDGTFKTCPKIFSQLYTIQGCFFHFCQSLWRKYMTLDIEKNSSALILFYRKCCALAFVSPQMIEFSFKVLSREARDNFPEMNNFMKYLKETYVGDLYNTPMFPPAFWSVHNRVIQNQPRANNAVESWNRRLNSTSWVIHPCFFKFTEIILKQQQFTEDNIELRISGNHLRKQKKDTIMLDQRIQTLVANFSEIDLNDF